MNDTATAAPPRRRLIGFNLLSGIVLLIVGFYFGWWLGHQIHAESLDFIDDNDQAAPYRHERMNVKRSKAASRSRLELGIERNIGRLSND